MKFVDFKFGRVNIRAYQSIKNDLFRFLFLTWQQLKLE